MVIFNSYVKLPEGKIGDGGSYRFTHITHAYTSHVFRAVRSHQALRTSNAGKERDSLSCHSLFVGSKMTSNVAYSPTWFLQILFVVESPSMTFSDFSKDEKGIQGAGEVILGIRALQPCRRT